MKNYFKILIILLILVSLVILSGCSLDQEQNDHQKYPHEQITEVVYLYRL